MQNCVESFSTLKEEKIELKLRLAANAAVVVVSVLHSAAQPGRGKKKTELNSELKMLKFCMCSTAQWTPLSSMGTEASFSLAVLLAGCFTLNTEHSTLQWAAAAGLPRELSTFKIFMFKVD